ncbi:MAG: hypothetical protein FWE95_06190 [Planctomycetaceae bacterium]|nr:hypothetical protein [Planctomycetaceae bacterium]
MPSVSTGQKSIDVLKINNAEELVGLIDDAIKTIPEMGFFDASPVTRNDYNTLVVTQDPKVGFRKVGDFADHEAAILENRTVKCRFLDASWKIDTALAQQSDWGKEQVFSIETLTHLRSAFMMLARQIWYGAKENPDGFRGLYELIGSTTSDKSNADLHISAGGTGTGLSSVFAVSTGLDSIQLAWGSEGKLTEGDVTKIYLANPTITGAAPNQVIKAKESGAWWYAQEISGWCGLQVTSAYAFGRINNLTKAKPLDDAMLYELISRFPVGREPQAFFMTRRSLEQLRASRTATNATGAPAPTPTEVVGIPIIVTDAIVNNEETILTP